jgi:hypothetical protein
VNTATAGGAGDPNPGNNSATYVDTLPVIFRSGFESGDLSEWNGGSEPDSLETWLALPIAGASETRFVYDLATLVSPRALAPSPLALVLDEEGRTAFVVEARRVDPEAAIELRLVAAGDAAHASAWEAVASRLQELRLEWQPSTPGERDGTLALYLDGRLALWLDGFTGPQGRPVALRLMRARLADRYASAS